MDKLSQVREGFDRWDVDGVLITSPANRRWLSGFTGSAGLILVTAEKAILATDSRYWEQAELQAPDFEIFKQRDNPEDMGNFLQAGGAKRIAYEANYVTVLKASEMKKEKGVQWRALAKTVEPYRAIKTAEELSLIRSAALVTDKTVAEFPRLARPGMSEKAVAWEIEKFMRESGADCPAFDIIVASGPNSAKPHHHPGERTLQQGDIIIVDLGAEIGGYKSDLTRTFYLGDNPDDSFWTIYDTVRQAQAAAVGGIRSAVTGKHIDSLARAVINDAGFGENFGHGTGHSLGLEIHEDPRFSKRSDHVVMPVGAVMTVEPGIYLPGYGGVRIEDLVLVTSEGAELLSHAPKSPLIPVS